MRRSRHSVLNRSGWELWAHELEHLGEAADVALTGTHGQLGVLRARDRRLHTGDGYQRVGVSSFDNELDTGPSALFALHHTPRRQRLAERR